MNINPGAPGEGVTTMAQWNQSQFDEAVRRKYDVLGQNADSDTTRANATAQDVAQRPGMQAAADAAAMDRARVAADNQALVTGMNNQSARDVAGITGQTHRDVTGLQNQGAMDRTRLTTDTQRDIAGQSLGFDREKLAQQGQQFGQTFGLDVAKAQDTSEREWGTLGRPEYGNPAMNLHTGAMESTLKRPAVLRSGPSALDELTGRQSSGLSSPAGQPQASPAAVTSPTAKPSPAAAALSTMSDEQLYNAQGQGRRAAAATASPAAVSAASSDSSNPRNGLFETPARASMNGALDWSGKPAPKNRYNFDYGAGVGGELPAGKPLNLNLSIASPADSVRNMAKLRARAASGE
jgi:hypothetical protein